MSGLVGKIRVLEATVNKASAQRRIMSAFVEEDGRVRWGGDLFSKEDLKSRYPGFDWIFVTWAWGGSGGDHAAGN